MKTKRYLAAVLGAATIAACTEPDVFYSTAYPVVRVEMSVTADPIVTPPATEDGEASTEENPIIKIITEDMTAMAPMHAGGSYALDFSEYNGGPLQVNTSPYSETVTGLFIKAPGSDSLRFIYGVENYTCKIATYKDSLNVNKVVLTVDFTKYYQKLYPNDKVKTAIRREYTSANPK